MKRLKYYFTGILGNGFRRMLVEKKIERTVSQTVLTMPKDFHNSRNILLILPEDPLEALHQIDNIVSITSSLSTRHDVKIFILCEESVGPLFAHFYNEKDIYTYTKEERYLHSYKINGLKKTFLTKGIDLILLLERSPDLSLLYLMGIIKGKVRISYEDSATYPFSNIQVSSDKNPLYRTDQNLMMTRTLGLKPHSHITWDVSEAKQEELALLIKSSSLKEGSWIGGIDIDFFTATFGTEWTNSFLEQIQEIDSSNKRWYLYAKTLSDKKHYQWVESKKLPVFHDFVPSRLAALLHHTDLFITGKGVPFHLSYLLKKNVLGIFTKEQADIFCPPENHVHKIIYETVEEPTLINSILTKITGKEEKNHNQK